MDETTLPRSQDVNFLAVICQTNVPGDLLLRVFCFDVETQLDEVESFFSEHSVLSRGEGSSIQSVSWGAVIQVTIYGLEVPTKQYGVKLRYLKGQVFQDTSLIVRNVVNCIPQLMFTLVQSAEILSIVTLAPIEKTSKVTASVEMQASPVGFHSTEVEQGEESGSAAKIRRLDPIMEPGTSGVSSPSKKKKIMKVKQEEGNSSAAKKPKLEPAVLNLELQGYPALVRKRRL